MAFEVTSAPGRKPGGSPGRMLLREMWGLAGSGCEFRLTCFKFRVVDSGAS